MITEKWSGKSFSKKVPWTAVREFVVDEVSTPDGATAYTGVPQINDAYPGRPFLLCEGPVIAGTLGPQAWVVRCNYSVSQRGFHFEQYDSLLDQPMRWRWSAATATEKVDRDVDGNPLVNSARDPIPNATREFLYLNLMGWQYEAGYDLPKALAFGNTINSTPFVSGAVTMPVGSVRCASILPLDEFDGDAVIIRVGYQFNIRMTGDTASYGIAPFNWRFLDSGRRAWKTGPKVGELIGAMGQATTDVRLNGVGQPLDAAWTVEGDSAISMGTPTGATLETVTGAVFLRYKKYRSMDFSALF